MGRKLEYYTTAASDDKGPIYLLGKQHKGDAAADLGTTVEKLTTHEHHELPEEMTRLEAAEWISENIV